MAASWVLVPCLVSLRNEFNALAPNRDKSSDGSVGDTSHAAASSDHNPDETGNTPSEDADSTNEVHAIDVDRDLKLPGVDMEDCVQLIVARHRAGKDNRLQNVIFNRRIWSRSWGWTAHAYTGPNPHDHHAHFGARYTTAQENDTRPWGLLEEFDMALDAADLGKIEAIVKKYVGDVVQRYDADGKPIVGASNNPKMGVDSSLGLLGRDMGTVKAALESLEKSANLAPQVLTQALTAAAPAIAASVAALLPGDRDDITVDELTAAFVGALEDLAKRPPV